MGAEMRKWYAIYTKPRAEKKVFEQLQNYKFLAYLPLKKEIRQWKDRLKKVEVPLFPSYVFVKIDSKEAEKIPKQITGFIRYVIIGGKRIEVREKKIEVVEKMIRKR